MDREPRTSILPSARVLDYRREQLEGEMNDRGIAFSAEDNNATLLARLVVHSASCPERIIPLLSSCLEAPVTNDSVSRWALRNLNLVVASPRPGRSRMQAISQVVNQLCLRDDLPSGGARGGGGRDLGDDELHERRDIRADARAGGDENLHAQEDLHAGDDWLAQGDVRDRGDYHARDLHDIQAQDRPEGPRRGWTFGYCAECMREGRGPLTRILYHVCCVEHT